MSKNLPSNTFIFEDANWWNRINSGGILSGHDYHNEVNLAVDQFALLNNLEVKTLESSSIWYIEKN
jgi:hypothetical protein